MPGKDDPRIQRTRQRLHDALLSLLEEKPLQALTVREICQRADVHRSTFYLHYGAPEELLADVRGSFLQAIARRLEQADARDRADTHRCVTLALEYMLAHRPLMTLLSDGSVDPAFAQRLFTLPEIGSMLQAALPAAQDPLEQRAAVTFAIHGSYRLLQEWLADPGRDSAACLAQRILTLARRVVGS